MRYRLITAALLAALSMPALAQDAEEESGPLAFNVGIVSDYVFRGVSQTNEGPAIQAGMDYTHDSGFHAGVWASTVDFVDGDGANAEFDFYVGWGTQISDTVSFDATLLRYAYHDQSAYNYNELIFTLGVGDYLSFLVGYSNDVFNSGENGTYVSASGSYPLPWWDLTLEGSVGHYDLDKALGDSYQDFSVGLSRSFGQMSVGLSYAHATNDIDWGDNGGSRVFLTTLWEF
ncbi:MAG: TorF family putative porin [Lysobacterales bacterium]